MLANTSVLVLYVIRFSLYSNFGIFCLSPTAAMAAQDDPALRFSDIAEYFFVSHVDFKYTPKQHKKKYEQQTQDIIKNIVGHANVSGGIGIIKQLEYDSVIDSDSWSRMLKERLNIYLPSSVMHSSIRLETMAWGLYVFVKKSPTFITYKYGMHTRDSDASNKLVHDNDTCRQIMQQSVKQHVSAPDMARLRVGDVMESRQLELKCWENQTNMKSKLQAERTKYCLMAFPNLQGGGIMISGIKEDKASNTKVVQGYTLTDELLADTKEAITLMFDNQNKQMEEQCGRLKWNVDCMLLDDTESSEDQKCLLLIHVMQLEGGYFEHCPESYTIEQDGSLKQLTFNQWKQRLGVNIQCETNEPNLDVNSNDHALYVNEPLHASSFVTGSASRQDGIAETQRDSKDSGSDMNESVLDERLKFARSLSYSGTSYWESDREAISEAISWDISDVDSLLPLQKDGFFVPPKDTIVNSATDSDKMRRAINQVVAMAQGTTKIGCLVLSTESWISRISTILPYHQQCDLACDLLVVCADGSINLTSVVEGYSDISDYEAHSRVVCKVMKREILLSIEERQCRKLSSRVSFTITPFVYDLHKEVLLPVPFSTDMGLAIQTVKHIQPKVADLSLMKTGILGLLLNHTSQVKNRLGTAWHCQVTSDQMQQLLNTSLTSFNFIVGPPGSGKSIMAHHICNFFGGQGDKSKVRYICTQPGFVEYVNSQGNATISLLMDDDQMDSILHDIEHSSMLKCVIVDDAHNVGIHPETWTRFFRTIKSAPRLIYLYIFTDPHFQNFNGEENSRTLQAAFHDFVIANHVPHTSKVMTEVLRNSRKIGSFMKANVGFAIRDQVELQCIDPKSAVDGDDVKLQRLDNLDSDGTDNGLLLLLQEALKPGFSSEYHYIATDIAILVDDDDQDVANEIAGRYQRIFREHAHHIHIQSATTFPVKGLVIDIVNNFSGLDANYCIFLVPAEPTNNVEITGQRSLSNLKYKNFIASRGVMRVDFVLPKPITASVAKGMMINDFSHLPKGNQG